MDLRLRMPVEIGLFHGPLLEERQLKKSSPSP
jgi:hypothetical protein